MDRSGSGMVKGKKDQNDRAVLQPGLRTGEVSVPSSKSQLHRLLICAALGSSPVRISFRGLSEDIRATACCLNALGADIEAKEEKDGSGVLDVTPLDRNQPVSGAVLDCGESGSTLRFLLPVAGLLGADCRFLMRGRLPKRPLTYYDEQLRSHGMTLQQDGDVLNVSGRLTADEYVLPGNISSQYISGLLMAFGSLTGESRLRVEGTPESMPYIEMTEDVLRRCGIRFEREGAVWTVTGPQEYKLPAPVQAEGDYSSATFFLCLGALSRNGVVVKGLDPDSVQGDRAVLTILKQIGASVRQTEEGILVKRSALRGISIDASDIPDAVPALAALAALCEGSTRIYGAQRLRLKESDRIASTLAMLKAAGAGAKETEDGMIVHGRPSLEGGIVDSFGDHRIAMASAVLAAGCTGPVTVSGASCIAKSYPEFWNDFNRLDKERS